MWIAADAAPAKSQSIRLRTILAGGAGFCAMHHGGGCATSPTRVSPGLDPRAQKLPKAASLFKKFVASAK